MKAPCKDCEKRYLGCHDKCSSYKVWKDERDSGKENRFTDFWGGRKYKKRFDCPPLPHKTYIRKEDK